MAAYYNEIDPNAARWLRNLISAGHIAPGEVDERDMLDVRPDELAGFTQCHFFAGIGVWSYALRQAGWPDDRTVWTGSCPCQPFSAAGQGKGFADERHIWPAWFHLIRECRPEVIFGEQVASKDGLTWLDLVCDDMEGEAYAIGAVDTCAAGFGAPQIRQRIYWVADASRERWNGREDTAGKTGRPLSKAGSYPSGQWENPEWITCSDGYKRPIEPGIVPVVTGTTARVGRLRGYGNALNAEQAKVFIQAYIETLAE